MGEWETPTEYNRTRALEWHRANPDRAKERAHTTYLRTTQKVRERSLAWRASHPLEWNAITKTRDLRRRYKLSRSEYLELVELAAGQCAICHDQKPLTIDHDHKTGKVRGLLCRQCNLGLGGFADSIERITNALKYLER